MERRAGETFKADAVLDEEQYELARRLSAATKHIGSIDCDVMKSDRNSAIIDLNPRFDGGYSLSHLADANQPRLILEELINGVVDKDWVVRVLLTCLISSDHDHLEYGLL